MWQLIQLVASFHIYMRPKLFWGLVIALVNEFCVGNFEIFMAVKI